MRYYLVYLHITVIIYLVEKPVFLIMHIQSLVHPCDEANKGGCSQICNKRKEKHECSCEPGFVLAENNATCKKG